MRRSRFSQILKKIRYLSGRMHWLLVMAPPPQAARQAVDHEVALLENELTALLQALPPGVIYLLMALYYLARGHRGDFLDLYTMLSDRYPRPRQALTHLLVDPPYLGVRVDAGLRLLRRADVNHKLYFAGSWPTPASRFQKGSDL